MDGNTANEIDVGGTTQHNTAKTEAKLISYKYTKS